MQTVAKNVLINYEVVNPIGEKTILILHGWGRDLREWLPFSSRLPSDYKVVLLDLPGFGGSTLLQYTKRASRDYAILVKDFMSKLKIKNPIIIGHSFGGKVAVLLESETRLSSTLFLLAPSGIINKDFASRCKVFLAKLIKPVAILFGKGFTNTLVDLFSSPDYREAGPRKELFKKIVKEDITSFAKKVRAKTIIIWGENDAEVPISSAKKLNKLIPNSVIRIVWGSGHDPHLNQPDKLLGILLDYL
jgi:pimeloyl-ACP methyl ester carboxylesterase